MADAHRGRTGTEPADARHGGAAPAVPCRSRNRGRRRARLRRRRRRAARRGHTPGSIALHLPRLGVLLTGDLVAESRGNIILGPFNTDRDQSRRSISRLAGTEARITGFGHGEAVLIDAAQQLAHYTDPLA